MNHIKLKRITILLILMLFCATKSTAQITITPVVIDEIKCEYPDIARFLESRLRNNISKSCNSSMDEASRFIISADIITESEYNTPTYPPKVAMIINLQLTIGDYPTGQRFAVETIIAKGVGNTSHDAIQNAIQNALKQQDAITSLIDLGKRRIIDFYNQNHESIINAALASTLNGDFDEALYTLSLIPVESDGYRNAQGHIETIYNKRQTHLAHETLYKAKAIWERGHSNEAAGEALELLASIAPTYHNFKEVEKLSSEIQQSINSQEIRQAKETIKQNAHEREMEKMELKGRLEHQKREDIANQTEIEERAKNINLLIQANRDVKMAKIRTQQEAISAAKEVAREYARKRNNIFVVNRHYWH